MILDWVAREGWIFVSWWLLVSVAGWAVFPMLARLLSALPDRGYTLSRAAGVLLVAVAHWLLVSLGFLQNTAGGILIAFCVVLGLSLGLYFTQPSRMDWRAWWQQHRRAVLVSELLFLGLFLAWVLYRAHFPHINGTEKPMELAFMSGAQRSLSFPPNDPWLAGYAISYYYLGYVITAMLSIMSGISSTIGFNMMIALLFALAGLTAFGVIYNLVRSRQLAQVSPQNGPSAAIVTGVLGAFFLVLMSNFQMPLIEVPYQMRSVDSAYLSVWDTAQRTEPKLALPEGVTPGLDQWEHWWWFRASRVLVDYNLDGTVAGSAQPIDEFPQFSFLLADVHPHVLALPFAVLAMGLALNLLLTWRPPNTAETLLYGVIGGALLFLNAWDGPIYMIVILGADALRRAMRSGTGRLSWGDLLAVAFLGLKFAVITVVVYGLFLISFNSQASGFVANMNHPTHFGQFFIMFGPFILLLIPFLIVEARRGSGRMNWALGGLVALIGLLVLSLIMLVFGLLNYMVLNIDFTAMLGPFLARRLSFGGVTVLLLLGLAVIVARLFPRVPRFDDLEDAESVPLEARQVITYSRGTAFALLLAAAGMVLVLVPEFLYLRDNFGVRINTIFKFYYQAWALFSIASAYGVYSVLADRDHSRPAPALRAAFTAFVTLIVALGAIYPVLGVYHRVYVEGGRGMAIEPGPLSLDGGRSLIASQTDYDAVMCLADLVQGQQDVVVVEATGGAYDSRFGRVGALTGIPILLGWENHQGQWRGATYGQTVGTRAQDIDKIYSDLRWDIIEPILHQYDVDYIFYGTTERQKYAEQGNAGEQKLMENLNVVCEYHDSRFYQVRR